MDDIITIDDMNLVYEVTDELGIDRETIRVELTKEDPGSVRKGSDSGLGRGAADTIEIVLPQSTPLEEWLPTLRTEVQRLL